jgi:hypothetical protein
MAKAIAEIRSLAHAMSDEHRVKIQNSNILNAMNRLLGQGARNSPAGRVCQAFSFRA